MPKKIFLIVILGSSLLSFAANAAADGPVVKASVDKTAVFIGDRIRYTIESRYDSGIKIKFPQFNGNKIGDFEIKDSGINRTRGIFGKRRAIAWYEIAVYGTGKHVIPAAEVKYSEEKKDVWAAKKTDPIEVVVGSILPKIGRPQDIKDIKGPMRFSEIGWLLVLAIIAVTVILLSAYFIYRKAAGARPVRLPHETALEELEAARSNFSRNSDIKEYYVSISDSIRRYIERVFNLKAPEMTTEEFLNSLQDKHALSMDQKEILREFLKACDLVKFAKYRPSKSEMEAVYFTAKRFVEESRSAMSEKSERRGT